MFLVPPSKVFVHVNPVQINFDLESCLWFSSFALNLHASLLRTSVANTPSSSSPTEPSLMYMDVKMEAIMPRIIIESSVDAPQQRDRPKSMEIQISRFAITNIRELGSSRADLAQGIHALQEGSLVFASGFPSNGNDMCVVTDRILSHVAATDVIATPIQLNSPQSIASSSSDNLTKYALWSEPRDIWCIKLDPVWIDFYGARSIGPNRSIPFIDAVPVTFWIHGRQECPIVDFTPTINHQMTPKDSLILSVGQLQSLENNKINSNTINNPICDNDGNKKQSNDIKTMKKIDDNTADLHIIAHVSNLVSIQIDHYQYLFILRMAEEMTELATFLSLDSKRIMHQEDSNSSIVIGLVVPQVEITLVMPSQTPGKESSGGDAESVMPDSASLGTITGWPTTTPPLLENTRNSNQFGSVETPSPINEQRFDIPHTSNPNTHGYNVQILSEPITTTTTTTSTTSQQIPVTPIRSEATTPSSSSRSRNRNSMSDSTFSKDMTSGLLSMKKGFSNFMTSIDSALKTNPDDMSDTYSMHSDISSDSDNFMMIINDTDKTADCMDAMFSLNPFQAPENSIKVAPVEVASEVCEENVQYKTNMSSPSEPSEASSCKRRDLVSMVTFK